MKKNKIIIGRKDKVDFPLLKLFNIDAKIDTGAFTSALHCDHIRIEVEEGIEFIRFRFKHKKEFYLPLLSEKSIKNSFGDVEKRFVVETQIKIFNQRYQVELTLTDRSMMEYPVLLGRKLIEGNFLVDVSKIDLSYKEKSRRKKIEMNENF